MNKIYKVIWSKTKQAYVVTSEFAKGATKSKRIGLGLKKGLAAAVVMSLLTSGSVMAAGGYHYGTSASHSGDDAYSQGNYSLKWTPLSRPNFNQF